MAKDFSQFVKSRIRRFLSLILVAMSVVNCSNIFEPMSAKNSNDAYYEAGSKALDQSDFDTAISNFSKLTSGYLDSSPAIRRKYAGALAGKCGLVFATFYSSISGTNFGTTPLFKGLMNQFTQKAVSPSYCALAEAQMKAIWAVSTPTAGEQLFMVMLSMAKMGAYLRNKADHDSDDDLGDGTTDGTFDGCANTDDADHLTDAEVKEIITGFSLMLQNITAFSATLGLGDTVDDLTAVCAAIPDSPCSTSEVANVTDEMVASMRDLLATNENYTTANGALADIPYGVGSCAAATPLPGCCP